jgi:sodium transport system ATP-binding protein
MITVASYAKRFGAVQATRNVHFRANDGAITVLLGANGSGKTTTLRGIAGLLRGDGGSIHIDGLDVHAEPLAARARLGLFPDKLGLYPRLTPREHLRYFGELHGVRGAELQKRIDEVAKRLELGPILDRRTEGFSTGQRMLVGLGRALVHAPANVVLDEPSRGLDVLALRRLRAVLRELREEGRCVLFASHVMQEVTALADHVVVLANGETRAEGTPDALCEQASTADLEEAYVTLAGVKEVA